MDNLDRIKQDKRIYSWLLEGINDQLNSIDRVNYTAILDISIARLMLDDADEALELVSRFPTVHQIMTHGYIPATFHQAFNITIAESLNRVNKLHISALQLRRNCKQVLNTSYILLMILANPSKFSERIPPRDFMTFARKVINDNEQDPDVLLTQLFIDLEGDFSIHDQDISNMVTAFDNKQFDVAINEITDVLALPHSASIDLNMNDTEKLQRIVHEAIDVEPYMLYREYDKMHADFVDVNEIRNLTNPQFLADNAPTRVMYPYEHYIDLEI